MSKRYKKNNNNSNAIINSKWQCLYSLSPKPIQIEEIKTTTTLNPQNNREWKCQQHFYRDESELNQLKTKINSNNVFPENILYDTRQDCRNVCHPLSRSSQVINDEILGFLPHPSLDIIHSHFPSLMRKQSQLDKQKTIINLLDKRKIEFELPPASSVSSAVVVDRWKENLDKVLLLWDDANFKNAPLYIRKDLFDILFKDLELFPLDLNNSDTYYTYQTKVYIANILTNLLERITSLILLHSPYHTIASYLRYIVKIEKENRIKSSEYYKVILQQLLDELDLSFSKLYNNNDSDNGDGKIEIKKEIKDGSVNENQHILSVLTSPILFKLLINHVPGGDKIQDLTTILTSANDKEAENLKVKFLLFLINEVINQDISINQLFVIMTEVINIIANYTRDIFFDPENPEQSYKSEDFTITEWIRILERNEFKILKYIGRYPDRKSPKAHPKNYQFVSWDEINSQLIMSTWKQIVLTNFLLTLFDNDYRWQNVHGYSDLLEYIFNNVINDENENLIVEKIFYQNYKK
jgi:hypothetical protein